MTILFTLVAVGRICSCCLMMPLLATLETDPPLFTSGHTSRHFWVSPFITKFPSSTTPRNLWTCLPQPIMDRIWWAHTLRQRRAMLHILRDVISTPLNRSSLVPISSASHEYVRSLRAQIPVTEQPIALVPATSVQIVPAHPCLLKAVFVMLLLGPHLGCSCTSLDIVDLAALSKDCWRGGSARTLTTLLARHPSLLIYSGQARYPTSPSKAGLGIYSHFSPGSALHEWLNRSDWNHPNGFVDFGLDRDFPSPIFKSTVRFSEVSCGDWLTECSD